MNGVTLLFRLCAFCALFFPFYTTGQPLSAGDESTYVVSDFSNLSLDAEGFWNGSDESGGFSSGLVFFPNNYNPEWGAWSGWAYSRVTDNETPGWSNQFSAFPGHGVFPEEENPYAVSYVMGGASTFLLDEGAPHLVYGFYLTNTTYAASTMKHGDDYSKKFGGETGDDPDWFLLSVWGSVGDENTDTLEVYLADYRFEDNALNYILDEWEWVDVSSLGKVEALHFSLSSSDVGDWGMNTPAYFALDRIYVLPNQPPPVAYIHKVLEYTPAPGQQINKAPWGVPGSAESLVGGLEGSLSLGAFGGKVVFRFEEPVQNHPDNPYGVDFIIFGNPSAAWSEPGIVWVMKDENGNGQPDATWYQLAGSDYFFSSTRHNETITYFNPGEPGVSVPWETGGGETGHVYANEFHTQAYYPDHGLFPNIDPEKHVYKGTRIAGMIDDSNPVMIQSTPRAFGYADNRPRGGGPYDVPDNPYTGLRNNAGGDGFDISWAVNEHGEYVDLDEIHFIKVQTGVLGHGGWMGEVSTEVVGATRVRPDPDHEMEGSLEMVVIKDLPTVIDTPIHQLEAYAFNAGRVQLHRSILWNVEEGDAQIDDNMQLLVSGNGSLTLTAHLEDQPDIYARVVVEVELAEDPTFVAEADPVEVLAFPNPVTDGFRLQGNDPMEVMVMDIGGNVVFMQDDHMPGQTIDASGWPGGIYIVRVLSNGRVLHIKLVKRS